MTTRRIAIYYVDPVERGRRRKFVLDGAAHVLEEHYLMVGRSLAGGARFRSVGVYDFTEVDPETGEVVGVEAVRILQPTGIRTIRVEEFEEATPKQGSLLDAEEAA